MSNLQTQRERLPAKLEVRLSQTTPEDFKSFLLKQVFELYFKNGQKAPESNEAQMIVNELYSHLQSTWPGAKQQWIQSAFKIGITGNYGDFANISFRVLTTWISRHRQGMTRKDFGIKKDHMPTADKAGFILDGLRKRNPGIVGLDNKGKEALKKKINKIPKP